MPPIEYIGPLKDHPFLDMNSGGKDSYKGL